MTKRTYTKDQIDSHLDMFRKEMDVLLKHSNIDRDECWQFDQLLLNNEKIIDTLWSIIEEAKTERTRRP